ncbi:MAG: cysteine--tRNA ligase [Bacteroidetes bacterium]|nr:cysteine--tRNA ligase [Bacteroidota bacterium]
MMSTLSLFNTLSRSKQVFTPLNPDRVGLYVCGPTVYGDAHLGHARPATTFDVLFRYLEESGYKVRYVRNITDVGHLESDADEGEDKIAKKAVLDQVEPMEIVQRYTDRYHKNMDQLNVRKPSIEPRASGHIIEQQNMVRQILEAGYAYESNGSVYFDVDKYNQSFAYGKLSGRKLEDLLSTTRELEGQKEKKNPFDFALWKKASPEHLMHWPSEWSEGFPGWHLECSAMSAKYLGEEFDIHGGGMDLLFPHHECEIAQSQIANGKEAVKYWVHNNMITINGQKMGKSLGNFITLDQLFEGDHELLDQSYSPMTIRFFILQAHYRSTLDFSNDALKAAEKGLNKLLKAWETLQGIKASSHSTIQVENLEQSCESAMNDDLNTPILIAHLFEGVKWINLMSTEKEFLTEKDLETLKNLFDKYIFRVLGLLSESEGSLSDTHTPALIDLLLSLRQEAKKNKDFALADQIRNQLSDMGIVIKDGKEGSTWEINQ